MEATTLQAEFTLGNHRGFAFDTDDEERATSAGWEPPSRGPAIATGGRNEPGPFTELFGIASRMADAIEGVRNDVPMNRTRLLKVQEEFEAFERKQLGM